MKTFDFERKEHSKEKMAWLKANHKKPITESEFVLEMKKLLPFSKCKIHKSRKYSPSVLKKQYRILKKNYGFFNLT